MFNDLQTCPVKNLLWFHNLPWNHRMAGGETLFDHIKKTHVEAVQEAKNMAAEWKDLEGKIDGERFHGGLSARPYDGG